MEPGLLPRVAEAVLMLQKQAVMHMKKQLSIAINNGSIPMHVVRCARHFYIMLMMI